MFDNINLLTLAPVLNVQLLLDGLFIGAIFVLAAYGLALVWGVMNVKNLAQGEFVIMGGYLAWHLGTLGVHPILSMPIVIVIMFAFGWVLYLTIIRYVITRDLFTSLLATFGIALVLQQALNLAYGPEVRTAESGFQTHAILGGLVTVAEIKVISFFLCILLAAAVITFMKKSRMGQAIRATAQDARAAKIMGIDTERVYAFTYSLNAAICGAAGVLVSMIWVIQPFYGIPHSIRAFVIVTAAGLGNIPGVIITGLGLGVAEQYSGFVLGLEFQQATALILLLLVLIWRQIQLAQHRQVVQ
ncbi:branched-chain amino acid ABC transporter permease [Pelagibius marinus]|uniref:branched-chain amino acid ABC transporter permease n=1 Tax=Pelagibius marinus TaxID=2762760 RepID=UPI001873085A|nr:branched-chain amino acid ABC transporter permease [Pelagibius marinus]